MSLTNEDLNKLKAALPEDVLGVKVQSVSKDKRKALLVVYLQHTDVANRLEEVDPAWSFHITSETLGPNLCSVRARLTLKGVTRENGGEGDDPKSAYSDALKRCAMLFGVGRWLYDQEMVWVDYDENTMKYKAWTFQEYKAAMKPRQPSPPTSPAPTTKPAIKPLGRIYPDQPAPGDGTQPGGDLGAYVVQFGKKYKGRTFRDIGVNELKSYAKWLKDEAAAKGQPVNGAGNDFINQVELYVAAFENSDVA